MQNTTSLDARNAGTLTFGEGLRVQRLGFGAMRLVGPGIWGLPDHPEEAKKVLRRAVELGINFIDTAESYGPGTNEEQICKALYPYPSDLVIATKGGPTRQGPDLWGLDCRPERLKQFCEESLQRLRLDAIPLYYLHNVDPAVPFEDQIGALKDLRDEGKILNVGVSNVSLQQIRVAREIVPIAAVQNKYNVAERGSDDVVDFCAMNEMAFVPFYPLGAGDVATHRALKSVAQAHTVSVYQVALAWLLRRSGTMVPIPGTDLTTHLEDNVAACTLELADEEYDQLLHHAAQKDH